jgi:hypothetical protein
METSMIFLAPSAASDNAIPACPAPLNLIYSGQLIREVVQHVAADGYAGGAGDAPCELPAGSMSHAPRRGCTALPCVRSTYFTQGRL